MSKAERTRARLQECALLAFERYGFAGTTVARIAEDAGVTPMTFFRYFPSKEAAVLWDPFDPAIARAVAEQAGSTALQAACRGLLRAWRQVDDPEVVAVVRRRARLVAEEPQLRAALHVGQSATERAVADALRERYPDVEAVAAAGACLGALTAVLLDWARSDTTAGFGAAVTAALTSLDPEAGR